VKLSIEKLNFEYKPGNPVLKDVTMDALPGELTVLIGPNAAGKSTLLKCVAGLLKPQGVVRLNGQNTKKLLKGDVNKFISYLPQEISTRAILTVFEAILMGRLKTLSFRVSDSDLEKAFQVLAFLKIEDLAPRFLNELSGGQKQMVSIAQTLVSEPIILLLDEPISNLDLRHEMEILEIVKNITKEKGMTTIVAIHNLSLAARYADKLVVLKEGSVYDSGALKNVLSDNMLRDVFGVKAKLLVNGNIYQIIPLSPV
jgi:iron complex transport system ATP-binding protein